MTLADDPQNPKPQKKLAKSIDAITALREAMERRLAEAQKAGAYATAESGGSPADAPQQTPPKPEASQAEPEFDPAEWSRIMMSIAENSQKLMLDFLERNKCSLPNLPPFDPPISARRSPN
jgi:hypothetical protein